MRTAILALLAAVPLCAQPQGGIGIFEAQTDVGNPALKGSAAFDASNGQYTIKGAGANMWANSDQFHYVWGRDTGNFAIEATIHFPVAGAMPHRKAGIMVRENLNPDSAYLDAVVHGNGLTEIQFRETNGNMATRAVRFPIQGPVRIRLERIAGWYTMSAALEGQPLQEFGAMQLQLPNSVYAGLLVCSHKATVVETAVFSDVKFLPLPPTQAKRKPE